jgi:Ca2+-binding RTX toxin-like protein
MPQFRRLSATVAMVAVLTLAFSSIASAHWGPWHRFLRFDNVWIDTAGVNEFTAKTGDRDRIVGLGGDDALDAGDRNDLVRGGTGDDTMNGGDGNDILTGGPVDDVITGGAGRDIIRAGSGADTIYAEDGQRDWIRCGPGEDKYTADRFDRVAADCETDITLLEADTTP